MDTRDLDRQMDEQPDEIKKIIQNYVGCPACDVDGNFLTSKDKKKLGSYKDRLETCTCGWYCDFNKEWYMF